MTQTCPSKTAKPIYTLDFKRAHTVYKNAAGRQVPSVTTVLNMLDKPALVYWAWDLGTQGIDYQKVSERAANIGTIGHALCECHVRGMELDTSNLPKDMLDQAENTFLKFLDWWESNGLTCEASEFQMVSEALQVGGTADIVAIAPNGERWLVDLKTSKDIYREYRMQTAGAYAPMYTEVTGKPIDRVFIVRIGKQESGDFEAREVFDRKECVKAFRALRVAYERLKAVKK